MTLGLVFVGFGVLKYFPGASPAEDLTKDTTHLLLLGLVPDDVSIIGVATMECFIGLCLIVGNARWMRLAIWVLAVQLIGILSPLVLLPGRLFDGGMTLEGQYVLKDIVLAGAAMVIAAATFRGGRLVRSDLPPSAAARPGTPPTGEQKLRLIIDSRGEPERIAAICAEHGIPEAEFEAWREIAHLGAEAALDEVREPVPVS